MGRTPTVCRPFSYPGVRALLPSALRLRPLLEHQLQEVPHLQPPVHDVLRKPAAQRPHDLEGVVALRLSGYSCPTIVINFDMPSGTLPAYTVPDGEGGQVVIPEQRYSGASRVAYLPKNSEGEIMLKYLVRAFRYRWIFRVGTSLSRRGRKLRLLG